MIGMEDKKQFKAHGIRFARSLQMLVKMVNMFSADHKSASGMLQRSYEFLNPLVKQARYLTLGFVDQRVLLNNILTAEDSLKPLENEFLKRGIGAITFEAGITLAAYRNAVATISTSQKTIEENGGLLPFLEQRDLQFVRIFPAPKSETRNEDGDTVLDMGSEEYLISKALSNMNSGSRGVESILAQMDVSAAGAAAHSEDSGNGGRGSNGMACLYSGGPGGNGGQGNGGYLMDMQRMVEQKFDASLKNPEEDPQQAYVELARMLRNVRPAPAGRNSDRRRSRHRRRKSIPCAHAQPASHALRGPSGAEAGRICQGICPAQARPGPYPGGDSLDHAYAQTKASRSAGHDPLYRGAVSSLPGL